ncbi:MAG: hypothetical protein HQK78_15830 [Desulfobacterales bacterium]|nr:hypothetical protein [Desulfobacterales bacterium]
MAVEYLINATTQQTKKTIKDNKGKIDYREILLPDDFALVGTTTPGTACHQTTGTRLVPATITYVSGYPVAQLNGKGGCFMVMDEINKTTI